MGEVWVTARALEDGLDTLLTRSRAEAELGELLADVERLETFARALDEVHDEDESLSRTCRVGDLALDVSFTRGAAKVRAKATARPGRRPRRVRPEWWRQVVPVCSIAGLRARRRGAATWVVLDGGAVAVPRTLIHVAQQPYCPLHAVPLAWATTRVEASVDAVAALLDALDFYPGSQTNKTLLTEEQDDFCGSLSGGQRVKFELVRQVLLPHEKGMPCPDLLLLDEIFSPLDPASKAVGAEEYQRRLPRFYRVGHFPRGSWGLRAVLRLLHGCPALRARCGRRDGRI